ncbi:acyl-homoserine-lactone synthase [Sandarakinorhabdus sp.]|uniref:acyl-homoserine-lactone synthase n=1 Tax=Sandarakinorhabdus sp. TaxID=1916663 RepID=UPI00286DF424|nr:acyl-homoserine-lactone synthase [Sandarakinorhabdus sp.]
MFGTATAGSSSTIAAVAGRYVDGGGVSVLERLRPATARRPEPLAQMLRDRKTVFIDQLGWDLRSPDGLREIDAYDGDDTLYLVAHQEQTMRHLGSVRLLPSTGPHLIGDLYPHLCAGGVPRGDDVWEITRLLTSPGLGRAQALQVRRQLSLGLFEHALSHGISRYTMMTHMAWLPSLLSIGWDAEPLGFPSGSGADAVGALQIFVNHETLHRLRDAWDFDSPAFSEIGPEQTMVF